MCYNYNELFLCSVIEWLEGMFFTLDGLVDMSA